MWNRNLDCFLGCEAEYKEADIVVFGAPYDSTTSFRPGTRFASVAMRKDSWGLETYSHYQEKDLCDSKIYDGGDLELPFGDTSNAIDQIENATAQLLQDNKLPVMIGGEHLVTLGAFRAVYKQYPNVCIIHFDAHTDLREDYLGNPLSHATVIRRCWDIVGDERIWQYGIRSGEKKEFKWAQEHTYLHPFDLKKLDKCVKALQGKPVYFTLDLDVLDPGIFPGTGTPEAGGVSFMELLAAIETISKLNIVGCDINELSPPLDQSGASTAVACKILRELLLALQPEEK